MQRGHIPGDPTPSCSPAKSELIWVLFGLVVALEEEIRRQSSPCDDVAHTFSMFLDQLLTKFLKLLVGCAPVIKLLIKRARYHFVS